MRKLRLELLLFVLVITCLSILWFVWNIHVDCFGTGISARAWIDLNADGVRNTDEPPLEDAEFVVNDRLRLVQPVSRGLSEYDGISELFLPVCFLKRYELVAIPPAGYELTTRQSFPVTTLHAEFGFHPLSEEVLPTPRPSRYTCERYDPPNPVFDLETAPDGVVWAIGPHNLDYLDEEIQQWLAVPHNGASTPIPRLSVEDIYFGTNGDVWIRDTDSEKAVYYDGHYHIYEHGDTFQATAVPAEVQHPDGSRWFADSVRVFVYYPQTDKWRLYSASDSRDPVVTRLATNGSIWLLERSASIGMFSPVAQDEFEWEVIEHEFSADEVLALNVDGSIHAIALAPDGAIWLADSRAVIRLDPNTNEMIRYPIWEWGIAQFHVPQDITVSPDGSVWVASGGRYPIAIQIIPESGQTNDAEWYVYDPRDGITDIEEVQRIVAATDGSIWLTGWNWNEDFSDVVYRCQPVAP